MRSRHIWLVAGMTGATIGAAFTYHLVATTDDPPTGPPSRVAQIASVSCERKPDIPVTSTNDKWAQASVTMQREEQPPVAKIRAVSAPSPHEAKATKPDLAEEEAMVQTITARLYDPSTTLAEMMQSDEMLKLSDESRERVVARIVGMLNRGEIDARAFMSNKR